MSGDFDERHDGGDQPYGRGRGGRHREHRGGHQPQRRQSFTIDDRLEVKLDLNLAYEIGSLIMETGSENPAVMTFAKQLLRTVSEED